MMTEPTAEVLFNNQIFPIVREVSNFAHKSIEESGLTDPYLPLMKFTHFNDVYDTLVYSRLIEKAIVMNPNINTIIDLGAGSSIPSLLAIKRSGRTEIKNVAVDIDQDAHGIGSENAHALGLNENFSFYMGNMEEAMDKLGPFGPDTLIVSNPPYIAAPEHLKDKFFIPVNGGLLGDDYMLSILNHEFTKGVHLALLWGSLTCPKEILPVMNRQFELMHMEAHRVHFGHYTTTEPLRSHLYRLKESGDVYFEHSDHEGEIQYVFGTILKAKGNHSLQSRISSSNL